MRRQAGARRPPALLSQEERSRLEELTATRIRRMRDSRLAVLETWFGQKKDATNAAIAEQLDRKPRSVMALTRRTITEVRLNASTLWETAKRRADTEWGPACRDETRTRGIAATLGRTEPEAFAIAADPEMRIAARRLLPLVLDDVLDRSSRYGISANATGRALAEAIQKTAREPRRHSFRPVAELLKTAGMKPAGYTGDLIRWAGYATSGNYAVFDNGNRPRIQMVLAQHPAGIREKAISETTGIPLQRANETLRNDPFAVRTKPGTWTLASPSSTPFTNARTAITAIITEAGGRASEEYIVEQLSTRYGIRPATTRTITRTRDFLKGCSGIEINPAAEAWTGELTEQADGFSDDGEPYIDWHATGTRPHRRKLRIHDIPEVVAHHAGGRPNTTSHLAITSPPGLGDITLTWCTGKGAPVTLRRTWKALEAIKVKPNDLIRMTFSPRGTIAFENLGQVDRRNQPKPGHTLRKYAPKGQGPATRLLNKLIIELLARRQWAIHTAAARTGVERHILYNLLNGAETTVDRAEAACQQMGIELRIGAGGPTGRSCQRSRSRPAQPASERLQEQLKADIRSHPGSTQPESARRLGIPRSWIQGTLRGDVPRLERAQRVAEALGTTISLGGTKTATAAEAATTTDGTIAKATSEVTRRQQHLLRNAAGTLETTPQVLNEPATADGIPGMNESGYLAGHIIRNDPESRREFNREMAAIRNRPNQWTDPNDPDVVNGTAIEGAMTALGLAEMPVLFQTTWPKRWAKPAGIETEQRGTWTPNAEETRAVLTAVADGRISDAFKSWWEEEALSET